jgi:hypothetical protein
MRKRIKLLNNKYFIIIIIFIFNFLYPVRCLLLPPGVRVTQVEYQWYMQR